MVEARTSAISSSAGGSLDLVVSLVVRGVALIAECKGAPPSESELECELGSFAREEGIAKAGRDK